MSDELQIERGQRPWNPAPGTELVDVLLEYDRPLLAVLAQRGHQWMARCVLGEIGEQSVWLYSRLEDDDIAIFQHGSPEAIDETADSLMSRDVTIAFAEEDVILFAASVYVGSEGSHTERLRQGIEEVHDQLQKIAREFADVTRQPA